MKLRMVIMALALFFLACEEDGYEEMEPAYRQVITIFGTVLDGSGMPLEGVTVELENQVRITGRTGCFLFEGIEVPAFNAVVRAEKKGFFSAVRTFQADGLSRREVVLILSRYDLSGTINGMEGGRVALDNGTAIELDAGSLQLPSGEDYDGKANVHFLQFDPLAPEFIDRMPGGLLGVELSGEESVLESFGMVGVKLLSPEGQQLKLKPGFPARLIIAVADNLEHIPASVPLWYFDQVSGLWREESVAEYDGSSLAGLVDHFSFWSANLSYPAVPLKGKVEFVETFITGHIASWRRLAGENKSARTERLTQDRSFSGKAPANEVLEFFVRNACGEVVYSATAGPFSVPGQLEDIVLEQGDYGFEIAGKGIDCAGKSLEKGIVQVRLDDRLYHHVFAEGAFEMAISACLEDAEADLRIVEASTGFASPWIRVRYRDGKMDAGDIAVCDDRTAYILYNIGEESRLLAGAFDAGCLADSMLDILSPVYTLDTIQAGISILVSRFSGKGSYRLGPGRFSCSINDPELLAAASGRDTVQQAGEIEGMLDISAFDGAGELLEGSFTGILCADPAVGISGQLRTVCSR